MEPSRDPASRLVHVATLSLCLLGVTVAAAPARAAEEAPTGAPSAPDSGDSITLGAGALVYHSPFKGEGTSVLPIPIASIHLGHFYLDGLEIGAVVAGPSDAPIVPRAEAFVAARAIAGSAREKITADAGVRLTMETPVATLSIAYRRDITDTFNGGEATARIERDWQFGRLTLTPAAQASWLDRRTPNHMYGISARQRQQMIDDKADVVLPAYVVTRGALNLGGDLTAAVRVNDRVMLIGQLGGSWLGKSIRDNPGIDEGFEAQAVIGLAYRFR